MDYDLKTASGIPGSSISFIYVDKHGKNQPWDFTKELA